MARASGSFVRTLEMTVRLVVMKHIHMAMLTPLPGFSYGSVDGDEVSELILEDTSQTELRMITKTEGCCVYRCSRGRQLKVW